jgi:hypothetical protein
MTFLFSRKLFQGNLNDFKGCYSNEEGLVIATGEGEEGEKVDLKTCLARELNLGPPA